eukprot:364971-Chlamydomonas_euryale.AAC.18
MSSAPVGGESAEAGCGGGGLERVGRHTCGGLCKEAWHTSGMIGGRLIDGWLIGGRLIGGRLIGGRLIGGRLIGGWLIGGRLIGDRLIGSRLIGARMPRGVSV